MNLTPNFQQYACLTDPVDGARRAGLLTMVKPAVSNSSTGGARHPRVVVLAVGALAAVLFIMHDQSGSQGALQISEATPPRHADAGADGASPAAVTRTAATRATPAILSLRPRIQAAEPDDDEDSVFGSHSWNPPPPPPPVAVKQAPPPPPTAPALPFTYLGKMLDSGKWEAYLSRGEETFVVREHSAIDANYRAETIAPPVLTITYLPLKQTQTMSIGEGE